LDYLPAVDWQQLVSLVIVALAATALLWRKVRPRRLTFERETHCGCAGSSQSAPQGSILFRARKGERRQIHVRAQ
jgi:hypothetical protein